MSGYRDQTVWIIGASSGMGAALARTLSRAGARLILSARRKDMLETLATELSAGAKVVAFDVADEDALHAAFDEVKTIAPRLDRVILLAGRYEPSTSDALDMKNVRDTLSANLYSAFGVVNLVVPYLKGQGAGQLALCGSVAGYSGLPNSQPYSATKAAIINLAESLRTERVVHNIDIRLISPGFVQTPMTDKNTFPMPMIITADEAASEIARGLLGSFFEIHFPRRFTRLMKMLRILPYPLYFALLRRVVK